MEVSPKVLREVEFRETRKGYHPDDVDEFLEKVAMGLDVLQQRLRQALERAERAEASAQARTEEVPADAGDVIGRTLVMAQRTADQAVAEARRQAAELVESANLQADAIVSDATDATARMKVEAEAEVRAELNRLEAVRHDLRSDVENLERHLDGERSRLQAALSDTLRWLDGNMTTLPAPPLSHISGSDASASQASPHFAETGTAENLTESWENRGSPTAQAQAPFDGADWASQENRASGLDESGQAWRS